MAQAESAPTTTRPHFASAGAVRRPSSPQRSRPLTARELAEDIVKSHQHLIDRLAAIPPNTVAASLEADEDDLVLRAETLRCHLLTMQQYVIAFMRDTASFTNALNTDRLRLDGLFRDIIGDLCGAIENAAETVRDGRAYREA
jgi:hypothetical protein